MGLKMKKGLVSKIIISLLITAIGATGAFAQSISASDAAALLKKTDASTAFTGTDFTANYSLVQEKPGQGKSVNTAIMYSTIRPRRCSCSWKNERRGRQRWEAQSI